MDETLPHGTLNGEGGLTMAKKLPIKHPIRTQNRDVVVSWIYTWSRQQNMSIHEQRIVLRILEQCQIEALQGVKLKPYTGKNAPRFEHGLWDVDVTMHVSNVIFSNREYNEIIDALDSLSGRFFTYEDDEVWWKCGFISNPKYQKRSGIITFRVANDLWNVLTKFARGYREFELNKALALPTTYAVRFYMLMSQQKDPFDITVEKLKLWLGIDENLYKTKDGKDRIDHLEERVIKPAKEALDSICPYTFDYTKVRENPYNIRSKVVGFRFFPKYQPQYRDQDLEKKELVAQISTSFLLDKNLIDYLKYNFGFEKEEIDRNKATLETAIKVIPDFIDQLSMLKGRARTATNPKGYVINAIKGMIEDYKRKG